MPEARKHPGVLAACLLAMLGNDSPSADAQAGALVTAETMLMIRGAITAQSKQKTPGRRRK